MPFYEVPTSLVATDARSPDTDVRFVYEHLKFFLSLPREFPLPAIEVAFEGGKVIVIDGHKYLRIANELGIPTIRTYAVTKAADAAARALAQLGVRAIPREILQREESLEVVRQNHVYFFEKPLGVQEKQRFREDIAGFFVRLRSPLLEEGVNRQIESRFPFEGLCGEFGARVPVADPAWPASYLEESRKFSRQVRRIVTFQGALFPG